MQLYMHEHYGKTPCCSVSIPNKGMRSYSHTELYCLREGNLYNAAAAVTPAASSAAVIVVVVVVVVDVVVVVVVLFLLLLDDQSGCAMK